ncbi:DUF590 family protein [Pelomyxa schiedti]|nr:DUF590 family protein [Pelomyxa schiedti]
MLRDAPVSVELADKEERSLLEVGENASDNLYEEADGTARPQRINLLLESFVGVGTPLKHAKVVGVPVGYVLKASRSGCQYLQRVDEFGTPIDEDEGHKDYGSGFKGDKHRPKFCASKKSLGKYFGIGVELYFRFLLFIILGNCLTVLAVLPNVIPHFLIDVDSSDWAISSLFNFGEIYNKRKLFYLSSYTEDTFYFWFASTLLIGLSWFFYGWGYFRFMQHFLSTRNVVEFDEHNFVEEIIPQNSHVSKYNRAFRFSFSIIVFISMLGISCGCTFGLTIIEKNVMSSTLASMGISLVITAVRLIWTQIAVLLNIFERHSTWSAYKSHLLFKWFSFKVLNLVVVYISRWLVMEQFASQFSYSWDIPDFPWEGSASESYTAEVENACGLVYMGDQFLTLVFVDLIVENFLEVFLPVVIPWVKRCYNCIKCCGNKVSHKQLKSEKRKNRPEFDIAEEYLEILYRQFVLYLGIPFFPSIAALYLFVNIVELLVDRFRLIYLCKKPPTLTVTLKRHIIFYMFSSAVVAFGSFPIGAGFILAGYDYGDPNQCPGGFWPWNYLKK